MATSFLNNYDYQNWIALNPSGYILNVKLKHPFSVTMHRAGCDFLVPYRHHASPRNFVGKHLTKLGGMSKPALEAFFLLAYFPSSRFRRFPDIRFCRLCKP